MDATSGDDKSSLLSSLNLKTLTIDQSRRTDAVLESPEKYGEGHLIIPHGVFRCINQVGSCNAGAGMDAIPEGAIGLCPIFAKTSVFCPEP